MSDLHVPILLLCREMPDGMDIKNLFINPKIIYMKNKIIDNVLNCHDCETSDD